MYRFEQVGGFHYKYRFKRATADVSTPCKSRQGGGAGAEGDEGSGGRFAAVRMGTRLIFATESH